MTAVGAFAALLGLLGLLWGMVERSNRKLGLLVGIYVLHLLTALVYYSYVQTNDADTKLYYFDMYDFYNRDFSLGTVAIIYMVQWLKEAVGGSYLDYFLLFQVFGVWGIMLLVRSIEELHIALDRPWTPLFTGLMLLPGMYFWTSAIGKDAPLFLASTLAVWCTLRFSRRWLWFGLALAIMVLIRPHVALVASVSLALALVAGKGVAPAVRIGAIVLAVGAVAFLANTVQSSLQVDLTSVGSIASYVENQTAVASTAAAAGGEAATLSLPMKLISLLYRPFFFDAGGVFGLVASVQNLFMLFATYVLARNAAVWREMFSAALPIRFATVFLFGMIVMLTLMYYNVGLGLRQREMFTPALIVLFTAIYSYRQHRTDPADQSSPALLAAPRHHAPI